MTVKYPGEQAVTVQSTAVKVSGRLTLRTWIELRRRLKTVRLQPISDSERVDAPRWRVWS
jgi:hypothetical protein